MALPSTQRAPPQGGATPTATPSRLSHNNFAAIKLRASSDIGPKCEAKRSGGREQIIFNCAAQCCKINSSFSHSNKLLLTRQQQNGGKGG